MNSVLFARVRALVDGLTGAGEAGLRCTPAGMLLVAEGQHPAVEEVRLGQSWWTKNTTLAAALTAMPTTTSGLTLYNGEVQGGRCYIVHRVTVAEEIPDATQQDSMAIWVACGRSFTAPTAGAVATGSYSGIKTYPGSAIVAVAATTVVADSPWLPVGTSAPGNTQYTGSNFRTTEVNFGRPFVVVPGGAFHLAASKLAGVASQTRYVIHWTEVQLVVA